MQASAPPRRNTRGRDPSRRQGPPPTHHSREGPGTTPEKHHPKRNGKETEGGGHAKGTARGHTTNRPQPRGAGNHTAETGGGGTTHSPHNKQGRQTTPTKARTGTRTHHQHTAHTPKRAHNTQPHNRRRHEPHKCTPHTKAQAPPAHHTQHTQTQTTETKQPPPPGGLQGRQKPLGRKGGPTKPAARSGERPQPETPERPRPTRGPGTTTPTPAPPPTPKPDPTTPSPADTPETNRGTIGNTSDPSGPTKTLGHRTPSPTTDQHKKPPDTDQRPHPAGPVPHRRTARTTATGIHAIGDTNTAKNQASTTPSPTPSLPAPTPTKPTHATAGSSTYITQTNSIKHTIAGNTPPSASPPVTSATGGHQSHHNR